uniref:Synaptotagmin n=1 Tax=Steinernema glaseri TaxID=37863 RepID=A0A1I7Z9W3_9BILA
MPAYILLVGCVGISVALVGVLCVYCVMHCWQLKKPVHANDKKRDHYMGQYTEVPVIRERTLLPQIKISGASSLSSPDYPFSTKDQVGDPSSFKTHLCECLPPQLLRMLFATYIHALQILFLHTRFDVFKSKLVSDFLKFLTREKLGLCPSVPVYVIFYNFVACP